MEAIAHLILAPIAIVILPHLMKISQVPVLDIQDGLKSAANALSSMKALETLMHSSMMVMVQMILACGKSIA